jgi:hypothetical protein
MRLALKSGGKPAELHMSTRRDMGTRRTSQEHLRSALKNETRRIALMSVTIEEAGGPVRRISL